MTTLTIPRHQRTGCLYQFTPDARAAIAHTRYAAWAVAHARIASDVDTDTAHRLFYRQLARECAREARHYFAQWQEARR